MAILIAIEIRVATLPRWASSLDRFADQLTPIVANATRGRYSPETEIDLVVFQGSVKAKIKLIGKIAAAIAAIGAFESGVDWLVKDGKWVADVVGRELARRGARVQKVELRPSTVTELRGILDRLERSREHPDPAEIGAIATKLRRAIRGLDPTDRDFVLEAIPDAKTILDHASREPATVEEQHSLAGSAPTPAPPKRRPARPPHVDDAILPTVRHRQRVHRRHRLGSVRTPPPDLEPNRTQTKLRR